MQTHIKLSDDVTKVSELKKKEEQKMHDVLLLLEDLSYREESSIKLIVDCLYDVGSINLINQKFRSRTLNRSLKLIAKVSKPAFKTIAWQWYKRNCPKLIANWLRTKVAFEPVVKVKQEAQLEEAQLEEAFLEAGLAKEVQPARRNSLVQLENQSHEIKYLRSQVRMLTSIVVGLIVVFGGTVVWLGSSLERYNLQTVEQLQNRIRVLEDSTDEPFATGKGN